MISDMLYNCSGTAVAAATIDNAAAVDAGNGIVTIPATAHGILLGSVHNSKIYISGTVAYDGQYEIVAVATNTINIRATYVAETFAGTETIVVGFYPNKKARITEIHLKLSGAGAAENFTAVVDSALGSTYDIAVETESTSGLTSVSRIFPELSIDRGDGIAFIFLNANSRTWTIRVMGKLEK